MLDAVELRLRGLMLEKLTERAMEEGARFLRMERTEPKEFCVTLRERDARILEDLAARYGVKCRRVCERGIYRWGRQALGRASLPVSLLLCAGLLFLMLTRIWAIDVRPATESVTEQLIERVEQILPELGVGRGCRAGAIDAAVLSARLRAEIPELTHAGVSVRGVYLVIDVAQENAVPEVYDIAAARDLVAGMDAIVERCDALAGHACVQPGDAVRRGQTLILGEERASGEQVRPVRAQGAVWAKVWLEGESRRPLGETVEVRTGRSEQASSLQFLSFSLPLKTAEGFARQEIEEEFLPVVGLFLPLHIVRHTYYETQPAYRTYDEMETIEQVRQEALQRAREQLPADAQELDVWTEVRIENGQACARAVVEARTDIAAQRSDLRDN